MDRINLLPHNLVLTSWPNRLRFSVERRFFATLGRAAAAAFGLVLLTAVLQGLLAKSYEAKTRELEARQKKTASELERVQVTVLELDGKEQALLLQIEGQSRRLDYLKQYQDRSGRWAEILGEVKRSMPYGVWLTELEGDPRRQVRLAGGAFQEDLVTEFMGDLKRVSRFEDVAFNFAKKGTAGKTEFIQFEVTCRVSDAAGGAR